MVEKIGHIKNPLTVIAIFAGIAEISGTIVLPFLEPQNQSTYLWFIMLFPSILVLIFFATLNFNHKSLYAPSDYKDENNFLKPLRYASFTEKQEKIIAEVVEVAESEKNEDIEVTDKVDNKKEDIILKDPFEPTKLEETVSSYNTQNHVSPEGYSASASSNGYQKTTGRIFDKIITAQKFSISKLAKELKLNFQTDINYTTSYGKDFMFDAVAVDSNSVNAVEVKYSKSGSLSSITIENILHNAERISYELSDNYNKDFTLHFVLVTGNTFVDEKSIKQRILMQANKYKVKVIVHVYSLRELTNEFEHFHLFPNVS